RKAGLSGTQGCSISVPARPRDSVSVFPGNMSTMMSGGAGKRPFSEFKAFPPAISTSAGTRSPAVCRGSKPSMQEAAGSARINLSLCLMISIRSCQRLTSDSMSLAAINILRNIYCFDIYKFTDAENTQLASITRLLDAAEGEARIGMNLSVDEPRAGFQQAGSDVLPTFSVSGKH